MKTLISTLSLLCIFTLSHPLLAQSKRVPASAGRLEFIEVEPNVKLHVTDLGEGQPIVLIHGWPLNDAMYEYQYQYFVQKGFRVIGISMRGFGKSDRPYGKYDFDVFSDDIKVVLDKLKIENAVLGGFSMGGAVVIHYMAKYNGAHVSKLALFAAAAPSWKQREGFPYGATDEAAAGLIHTTRTNRQQLIEDFGKAFGASENAISPTMSQWLASINSDASPYATTQSIIALRDLDLRPALSKINVPVAIFHGTKDKLCDFVFAEQLHKGLKNSYIVKFENSGHALFIEEMEKFNTELEKFTKK
ncbi:alpha/beta fold hydrolase [Flavobacterium sp. SORGH_AS_0622]|uniref:alpha/beta fold hydrolase n=1 Tax=Flavobacterium sp. SORGH_AS_0622 TaxID=3041772 RepID=UPI0027895E32|nr:alpha/beta hydrolase [Flavobacterium sp. SORGH_AS_0622]MDQ1166474.1 non-heme chloroperoxidase [Flavobacterium sp. SORGH_AS_0622]